MEMVSGGILIEMLILVSAESRMIYLGLPHNRAERLYKSNFEQIFGRIAHILGPFWIKISNEWLQRGLNRFVRSQCPLQKISSFDRSIEKKILFQTNQLTTFMSIECMQNPVKKKQQIYICEVIKENV